MHDLEKVFEICFTDQCLARLKQSLSLFPPRKLLTWAVNSSIPHFCILNDVKAKLSGKFHGETTLFASAFARPMKIHGRFVYLFDKPIKCFAFLFMFYFYVYFSRSCESGSNILDLQWQTTMKQKIILYSKHLNPSKGLTGLLF